MEDIKLTVGIEPTDAYEKAKMDIIQAAESIQLLTHAQRQRLAEEVLGAAGFASFCQLLG